MNRIKTLEIEIEVLEFNEASDKNINYIIATDFIENDYDFLTVYEALELKRSEIRCLKHRSNVHNNTTNIDKKTTIDMALIEMTQLNNLIYKLENMARVQVKTGKIITKS